MKKRNGIKLFIGLTAVSALVACGGGGDETSANVPNSGSSANSSSGAGISASAFQGIYNLKDSFDGSTATIEFDSAGNIKKCVMETVVNCTGKLVVEQATGNASFEISGNDGGNPVDTAANLSGTIRADGTVSGTYAGNSRSEGSFNGAFKGSRTQGPATSSGSTAGASACFSALIGTWSNSPIGSWVFTAPDSAEVTVAASDGSAAKQYTRLKVLSCTSTSLTYNITEAGVFRSTQGVWDYDYCAPNATAVTSGCDRTSTAVNWTKTYTQAYSFEQGGLKFGTYVYRK